MVLVVIMVTIRDLLVRRMSSAVPTMTIALTNALSVTVAFGIWSIFIEWAPITLRDMSALGAAAILVAAGYFCAIATMRHGEIAVVSPFRYSALLWALAIGFVFFGEWPDTLALIGGFVVVATGVYSFYRERRIAKSQPV